MISCGSHYVYNKHTFLFVHVAFLSAKKMVGGKNTIKRTDHFKATYFPSTAG